MDQKGNIDLNLKYVLFCMQLSNAYPYVTSGKEYCHRALTTFDILHYSPLGMSQTQI